MELMFLGQKIVIDKDVEKYIKILEGYYEVASDFQRRWKAGYSSAGSLKKVIEMIRNDGSKYHNALINKTMELLDENEGISDVDRNTFNKYYQRIMGKGILEERLQIFDDIIVQEPRKNKSLYEYSGTFSNLKMAIRNDAFSTVNIYINIIHERGGAFRGKVSDEVCQKVRSLLSRLEKEKMEKNELRDLLCECMQLHPFNDDIYFYAIKYFGDKEQEIRKIADIFFVDMDYLIKELMETVMQEVYEVLDVDEDLSLETVRKLKKKLEKAERFYGYNNEEDIELNALYDELDEYIEDLSWQDEPDEPNLYVKDNEKKFIFLDYDIFVSEEQIAYTQILGTYRNEAMVQASKLREKYARAGVLDTVISNVESWGTELLTEMAKTLLERIGELGIYSIDMDIINQKYSHYVDFETWRDAIERFAEKCAECVYSEEQMKAYREQRKSHRGRFVGGGFGVSGAIKGSIQAGALNMATGAFHSIVNAMGNMVSDARINSNKRNLYSQKSTVNELCDALYITALSMHNVYTEILRDEKNVYIGSPSKADIEKANAINNNIKAGRCRQEDISKALAESVSLNLYNSESYILAIQHFGDADGNIAEMAKFFLVDIERVKEEMMIKFFRSMEYDLISLETPKDINTWEARKEKVRVQEKRLGYSSIHSQKVYEFIDKGICAANMRYKIVNGKVYSSVEMAEAIKFDLSQIYGLADDLGISIDEAQKQVEDLELKTEEISRDRCQILEQRRKLKSADINEIEAEILKIKKEVMELPHDVDKDSIYAVSINGYLEGRYFDRNNSQYNVMVEKVNKAVPIENTEKVIAFITMLTGIVLNDIGLVITNRNLYFIDGKRVLFQSDWTSIEKIIVNKEKYVIYTKDGKIFSNEMRDITSEYICSVMNDYFVRIIEMFTVIYRNDKKQMVEQLDEQTIDKEQIIACLNEIKQSIWSYLKTIGYSINSNSIPVHYYGEKDFECTISGIKESAGNSFRDEIPLILFDTEKQGGNNMLITNRRIYWFNDTGFNKFIEIETVNRFNTVRKGLFSENLVVEFVSGTTEKLSIANVYSGHAASYVWMLNMAHDIVNRINSIIFES